MKTTVILALIATAALALYMLLPKHNGEREAIMMTGGVPDQGNALIRGYGCGSCHTIPGIPGANALVGPSLERFANRVYIAGVLENNPENLIRWIQDPPGVDPLTAMPNLKVSDADAKNIAAYLYTLQ